MLQEDKILTKSMEVNESVPRFSNDMVAKDREYPKHRLGMLKKDGGDSPVAAH